MLIVLSSKEETIISSSVEYAQVQNYFGLFHQNKIDERKI